MLQSGVNMKQLLKLIFIGMFAGLILAGILILLHLWTNNPAYILLFNVDYIPLLKDLGPKPMIGIIFHFTFCIISVVGLFYILKMINQERQVLFYVIVYTSGSAILYFLTVLSTRPPFVTDLSAWIYWTIAHAIYGLIVGLFVKNLT